MLEPVTGRVIGVGIDSSTGVFSDFFDVTGDAVVRTVPQVATGTNGFYGVDLTMRQLGCRGAARCSVALVGEIGIQIVPSLQKVECVGYENGKSVVSSPYRIDFRAENNVGCYHSGGKVYLYVNGEPVDPNGSFSVSTQATVELAVGVMISPYLAGNLTGHIGRVRYWTDIKKMKDTLLSGG